MQSVAEAKRPGYSWPEEGISRVPYWVYTDPEVYELEQQKIFRGPTWNYLGLEAEVPNAGDFKSTSSAPTCGGSSAAI